MMTKILATRLNTFLSHYIHPDQEDFVPRRQAPDQMRQIIDIISAIHFNWDEKWELSVCYFR